MDQTNETRLGSAPLGKLLFQLGLLGVAAQVINVLYNIVDRIYIGNIPGIGDMALTGVGLMKRRKLSTSKSCGLRKKITGIK